MGKKLVAENLPEEIDSSGLEQLFTSFGEVTSAHVILDTAGNSRGLGFVKMTNDDEADAAVQALDGSEHGGCEISVREAAAAKAGTGQRQRFGARTPRGGGGKTQHSRRSGSFGEGRGAYTGKGRGKGGGRNR